MSEGSEAEIAHDRIITGDAFDVLDDLPEESVHAIVTDPPYGLAFMGRDWDDFEPKEYQQWCEDWAREVKRVLKPGGHMLAFSGNRTHHRLFTGVEDAGLEIRDTITWHYGCLSDDTEVLTPGGWRSDDEIVEGDDVVAFDPDTETFAAESTASVFRHDHDGEMIRYQSPNTDQLVTPNHRVLHQKAGEWETTYATHSYGNMELPVIHASGKIRLSGDKDVSGLSVGVGRNNVERDGGTGSVLAGLLERTSGVDTTRDVNRPGKQTTGGTRRDCDSGVYQLRRDNPEAARPGRRKRLLFERLLPRLEGRRSGLSFTPPRDSSKGGEVPRGVEAPFGEYDGGEQPGMERRRYVQTPKRELQAGGVGSVPAGVLGYGAVERVRSGSPSESGEGTRPRTNQYRSGASQRPRQPQQRFGESGVVAEQPGSQVGRGGPGGVSVGTTVARTSRVAYSGTVWCVQVPSSYFVARRNGQVFITGNSGFPKGADVSKSIDKQADVEREVVDEASIAYPDSDTWGEPTHGDGENRDKYGSFADEGSDPTATREVTAPATADAKTWAGWHTQLKPATEFVVVARKPLSEGTIVENVLEHGTGALNIDRTRLDAGCGDSRDGEETADQRYSDCGGTDISATPGPRGGCANGRYPANVVFDEAAAAQLDQQTGDLEPPGGPAKDGVEAEFGYNGYDGDWGQGQVYPDEHGGASRFFYTSKANKAERTLDGRIDNAHPTVKPLDLMDWLVRLVTAKEQIVLDPFCGTGTTCKAAKDLGRRFVGIEEQQRWADVARVRCGLSPDDPSHVRPDDAQSGFEAFAGGGSGD